MTSPMQQPRIATPPINKTMINCCAYTCAQGTPQVWVCPGCGKRWEPPAPLEAPPA